MTEKFAMLEIKLYMATGSLYKNYKLIVNISNIVLILTRSAENI